MAKQLMLDPTSNLGRFEDNIRREEAKVLGKQELAALKRVGTHAVAAGE